MNFVWIYAKPFSYYAKSGLWNEIEYSIKSVRKFYPDPDIYVVGDQVPGEKHIPADRIITHVTNRPIDMDAIRKFRIIIDKLPGEFVLMYDDIFLLQPADHKEITTNYARCRVDDIESYRRAWSRDYKFLWRDTYRLIKEFRNDLYDWETHLPRFMETDKLARILDEYNCDNTPLIATSIYSAKYGDTVLMDDKTQLNLMRVNVDLDEGFKCKYLNIMDDSITPEFKQKMKEVFGESTSVKPSHR